MIINNILPAMKLSQCKHKVNKVIKSLLPNPVVAVLSSGSEEKVAKIFPKIIQTDKKQIFSFPILLRSFFLKYPE